MGLCIGTQNNEQAVVQKEEKFQSMRKEQNLKDQGELTVTKADFVLERTGKFTDHYKVGEEIGRGKAGNVNEIPGAFGEVRKCHNKITNEPRAVKILRKEHMDEAEMVRMKYEIDILKNLDHPNIVRLYEVFEDKLRFFLVTEMCTGGELFDEIIDRVNFTESEAAVIIKQVLGAIAYCHEMKVVHRDLKPENILLDSRKGDIVKVIDFGTGRTINEDDPKMTQTFGTAYYIAPEVLKGNYTEKCDIWSLGVILYILLSGNPPFNGETDNAIVKKVKAGKWEFREAIWQKRSDSVKDLIKKLLTYEYTARPTALEALEHPWLQMKASKEDKDAASFALNNLKGFRKEQKLSQAAMTFIVSQLSTKQEQLDLQHSFKAIDKNCNGKISKEELIEAYLEMYAGKMNKEEIIKEAEKVFSVADTDGSGEIDYSEWAVATIAKDQILTEQKLRGAFNMFDKDGSGSISADEIKTVLGVGKKFGDEKVWEQIIKEVDINGDGVICFDEFKYMMEKFLESS